MGVVSDADDGSVPDSGPLYREDVAVGVCHLRMCLLLKGLYATWVQTPQEWRSAYINQGAFNFSVAHVGLQTLNY
jgi:hypothetical protein